MLIPSGSNNLHPQTLTQIQVVKLIDPQFTDYSQPLLPNLVFT